MWDAIILGQVPGTTSRLSYAAVLSLALLLLMLVLVRSVARRRSSWYWRVYAEMELYGVEDELFPYSNDAGRFGAPMKPSRRHETGYPHLADHAPSTA